MKLDAIREQLKRHEGFVAHAYQDHLGYWTIGYGRLIDERRGGGISQDEAQELLDNDIAHIVEQLKQQMPRLHRYPERVQSALINMAFQMGVAGLMEFEDMIAALEEGDYPNAAREALNSLWAKKQTPNRASEIAEMLRGE